MGSSNFGEPCIFQHQSKVIKSVLRSAISVLKTISYYAILPAKMSRKFTCLILLLLAISPPVLADDDFATFDKLSKDKDEGERVKAIDAIKGYANLRSTQLITHLLGDEHPRVRYRAVIALSKLENTEAMEWLIKNGLKDNNDFIRLGTAEILGKITAKQSVMALLDVIKDKNPNVAAEAIYSLGHIGNTSVTDKLIDSYNSSKPWQIKAALVESVAKLDTSKSLEIIKKALQDKDYQVRMTAIETIPSVNKEEAVKVVHNAINDKDWRVRVSAIETTQLIRDKRCITELIDRLTDEQGRLKLDILITLKDLTDKEIGLNIKDWKNWWDSNKDTFQPIERKDSKPRDSKQVIPQNVTAAQFYNVPILSNRVSFILDLSGSMRYKAEGDEKNKNADTTKLDIAKKEMIKTIEKFDNKTFFNIILLGSDEDSNYDKKQKIWKVTLMQAIPQNKQDAIGFINKQKAKGWTNIYDAIEYAFEDENVDTTFLLSDGGASKGKFVYTNDILYHIKKMNKFRKIMINTIETEATNNDNRRLMRELAEITKGTYTPK